MVLIPLEIQDYIIDAFAEHRPRKELLQLRFVSQWRPRVDFHAFARMKLMLDRIPAFINLIKSSKYGIGKNVKILVISSNVFTSVPVLADGSAPVWLVDAGYSSINSYISDFTTSVPNVESLTITNLNRKQIKLLPHFPRLKHLRFKHTSLLPSQLFEMVRVATRLTSIHQLGSSLDAEEVWSAAIDSDSDGITTLPQPISKLTAYSTSFSGSISDPTQLFESVLFSATAKLPKASLQYLTCRMGSPTVLPTMANIINPSTQSLQYLILRLAPYSELHGSGTTTH